MHVWNRVGLYVRDLESLPKLPNLNIKVSSSIPKNARKLEAFLHYFTWELVILYNELLQFTAFYYELGENARNWSNSSYHTTISQMRRKVTRDLPVFEALNRNEASFDSEIFPTGYLGLSLLGVSCSDIDAEASVCEGELVKRPYDYWCFTIDVRAPSTSTSFLFTLILPDIVPNFSTKIGLASDFFFFFLVSMASTRVVF